MNLLFLKKALAQREQANTLRRLQPSSENMVDFTSNDYLGLARSAQLWARFQKRIGEIEIATGSGGSRLLAGNYSRLEELEQRLGKFFQGEALFFSSGYAANVGLLSAIAGPKDIIFYDSEAHASLKDGARLALAKSFSFYHNDLSDLERRLKEKSNTKTKCFIVVESLYSMSGDFAPLKELVSLCQKYNGYLIIDEAHSTGLYAKGAGCSVAEGVQEDTLARIYTFGKALGSMGAVVVGSPELKSFLINHARTFIYSTAVQKFSIEHLHLCFDFLEEEHTSLFKKLTENISILCSDKSESPIQPFYIETSRAVKQRTERIQKAGFDVRPIVSPTVPKGKERIRVIVHSFNTHEEIKELRGLLQP